jgi:hypothetical protein
VDTLTPTPPNSGVHDPIAGTTRDQPVGRDWLVVVGILAVIAIAVIALIAGPDENQTRILTVVVAAISTLVGFAFGHRAGSRAHAAGVAAAHEAFRAALAVGAATRPIAGAELADPPSIESTGIDDDPPA